MAKPVIPPLYLSTTYRRNADGSYDDDYVYASLNNPNRQQLEDELTALEYGATGFAFASGMAAISTLFQALQTGDHVLIPHDVFFQVRQLLTGVFARWGLQHTTVNMCDLNAVQKALQPNTKLIYLETPSNPLLEITDLSSIVWLAKEHGCLMAVDNTWASPVLQNPLRLGADAVIHSTTKYIGGHHDVIGGAIILKEKNELSDRIGEQQKRCGAVPAPFDCWLLSRGIKTLRLRVLQQSASALTLARHLSFHPGVQQVFYPGLESHPQHDIASQQMPHGFGGMLSVLIDGDAAKARAISHALAYFTCATSLGGADSLVEHRRSVEGPQSRAPENLLRISVGLEPVADLIDDWEQALSSTE